MPRYTISTPEGTFDIDSPTELTDAQAYAAIAANKPAPAAPPRQPSGTVAPTESGSYWGGFWQGLKDYAKDLVTDPKTMGMVGAGVAAAAVPATGGLSALAIPALGAAGGAGAAMAGRQLRTGTPEDALDVVGEMGKEGALNAALAAVPGAARWAAPKLADRATRLAAKPFWERHAPAAATAALTHNPALAAAVEVAQSPIANRAAARAAKFVGEDLPDAAASLGRRFAGSADQAPLAVDRYMANESGAPRPRLSREVPGYTMDGPAARPAPAPAPADELPVSLDALVEQSRYAPNRSSYQPRTWGDVDMVNGDPNAAALPFTDGVERYMPNRSAFDVPERTWRSQAAQIERMTDSAPGSLAADTLPMPRSAQAEVDDLVLRGQEAYLEPLTRRAVPAPERGARPANPIFDDEPNPFERYAPNESGYQPGAPVADPAPMPRSAQADVDALLDRYAPNASGYDPAALERALDSAPGSMELPESFRVLRGFEAFEDVMARPNPIAAPERPARAVAGAGNPPTMEQPYQPAMFGDDSLAALERQAQQPGRPDLSIDWNDPALQAFEFEGSAAPARAVAPEPATVGAGRTTNLSTGDRARNAAELRRQMGRIDDVKSALRNLGYTANEAAQAATAATASTNTTDEAIAAALRQLSPRR